MLLVINSHVFGLKTFFCFPALWPVSRLLHPRPEGRGFQKKKVRAAGIMPGTAAVFSKVVPEEYIQKYKVVFTTKDDVGAMSKVLKRAIEVLLDKYPNSIDEIKEKFVDVL
ncbi:hypothetical protein [Thermococcus sp. PK]|uniref:hypothetical protein n=1 Tax=Thermococcus sp. PK TaxID=913025 RepID=UPI0005B28411|nr:hypothetical protein [Thermococcus sp. PK]